jgi:hypothetical protein
VAQERASLEGFGGLSLNALTSESFTPSGGARLGVSSDRVGPIGNAAATLALQFVDRTTPTLGAGCGLLVRGGPVVFDIGYRYKQYQPAPVTGRAGVKVIVTSSMRWRPPPAPVPA